MLLLLLEFKFTLQLESSHKQIIIVHRYSRLACLLLSMSSFQSTMICHRCFFQCDGNSNKQGKNMYFVQLHKDEKERSEWLIFCSTELAIYPCHHPYYIYRRRSQNKSNHQFDSIRIESNVKEEASIQSRSNRISLSLSLSAVCSHVDCIPIILYATVL